MNAELRGTGCVSLEHDGTRKPQTGLCSLTDLEVTRCRRFAIDKQKQWPRGTCKWDKDPRPTESRIPARVIKNEWVRKGET